MARVAVWVALALVASGGGAGGARAQQTGATSVRGVVRSGGEAVPYAVVSLVPGHAQRFTDDSGAFLITAVAPGRYRLLVRQIGFKPLDTTVVKVVGTPLEVTVSLERLAIELAEITVTAPRRCTAPGPPDTAEGSNLAAVFDQLRQNAERYALLADSYPFVLRIARAFVDYDGADQVVWSAADTVRFQSNARTRYRAGDVVGWGTGPARSRARIVNLPTLSDLADSAFLANHCFAFGGESERDGERLVQVQFRAADSLRTPDIDGEVELDARSYQVRRATIRLTRAGRALPGLLSAASVVTFAELYSNILVPKVVESTLVPVFRSDVRNPVARSTEQRHLLDVHFLRPLPGRPPGP
jgi:hypothetical protein